VPPRRVIKAALIADDVRNKLSNSELMVKYGLSRKNLRAVLIKLVKAKALRPSEVLDRKTSRPDQSSQRRKVPRAYVDFALPIRDVESPSGKAFIRDLSEKGLRIAALEETIASDVGEVKLFEVMANPVRGIKPVRLEAICRWIRSKENQFKYVLAGYEISRISDTDMENLRRLLKSLARRRSPA
jgi:hypothetical protein